MWGAIAGAGLGLAGGLLAPKPYGGKEYPFATSGDQRRREVGSSLGALDRLESGSAADIMGAAGINQLLAGQRADLESAANEARGNATMRAITSGLGTGSGMLERRQGEIDRNLLDNIRRLRSGVTGQVAMQIPNWRLAASGQKLGFLGNQDAAAAAENARMDQYRAGRQAFGSGLYRGIMGAAAGMQMGPSLQGLFGGGGASSGGGSPMYGGNVDWNGYG